MNVLFIYLLARRFSSKIRSMSEKLKYVLTFNHPGRSECTHAALWGLIADLSGLMGNNGIKKDLVQWKLMGI